jgi:hypothetical protein
MHTPTSTISTTISYTDQCDSTPGGNVFAFPTKVTNALGQPVQIRWDCNIGKQTNYQDITGIQTAYSYSSSPSSPEPFDRLLKAKRGLNQNGIETHIAFSYPNIQTVTTKQDQASLDDGALATTVSYDGLERQIHTQSALGGGCYINVDRSYDGKGRLYKSSLPYNSCTETPHYSTTTYDGADRTLSVATEDLSATTTTYNGNLVTVNAAAGVSTTSTMDALGRLKSVLQGPTTTSYGYDLLDDLTSVTQGVQTRTFTARVSERASGSTITSSRLRTAFSFAAGSRSSNAWACRRS